MRPQLYIMVKQPRAGRVKTRLGRDIGMAASAWWFRHSVARHIRALSADPRWETVLAVSPDVEGMASRVWPRNLRRWPQGGGDLGARMGRILHRAPKGPVIIIGADIPDITPALIHKAFKSLNNHDAVIGPAPDGGYWLVGHRRAGRCVPRDLFKGVRWSSETARADTIASLSGQSVALIDTLRDVDTLADLRALGG
ncbi:hypothetical protein GCM10007939_19910 [Amylibacter marinus]|uniref:Glycosyltransferase n=1 Tax=Amylibacter marinus TaxID=1475483 RepID=A0ABQ5VW89_9RHOB|nr:TIGR04282 family arsenosugar biosynthesis glycosyltransferase [Amylibacter marinus]GLQ35708.1 hypothetical protein GCM10007939_19910 [Amylibacter marinus]